MIAESAVIGVPDPIRQQEVKACVVLKPPADFTTVPPQEIWSFCREHLAGFKVPRYIEYCESLPKTPSSKIQKSLLREELREETSAPVKILFDRATVEQR
jgi:crotonobetaine/carnitine-CoA ligase